MNNLHSSDNMSEVSDVIEFSPEVRLGNEKLVKVTIPAAQKLTELMDREKKGGFLRLPL